MRDSVQTFLNWSELKLEDNMGCLIQKCLTFENAVISGWKWMKFGTRYILAFETDLFFSIFAVWYVILCHYHNDRSLIETWM